MQSLKYYLKIFMVLALFSISYSLTSLYLLYAQNSHAMPDILHNAKDVIAPDNLSCFYAQEKDNYLRLINEAPMSENSIFFHETTCQKTLRYRDACSIESAARAHPNKEVYVVFTRSLTKTDCGTGVLAELGKIFNVHFYRLDMRTYAHDTVLHKVFMPRLTPLGTWHYRRIGELLKFLTLYKFGGVMIDMDMMVVASLDRLGTDWVSREGDSFESGAISLSRGLSGKYYAQWFLKALKRQVAKHGRTNDDSAIKDALQALCNTTDVREMKRENCKGFRIYSKEFFHPGNQTWASLQPTLPPADRSGYLGYHLWRDSGATVPNTSLYANLAMRYCPTVYYNYMAKGMGEIQT